MRKFCFHSYIKATKITLKFIMLLLALIQLMLEIISVNLTQCIFNISLPFLLCSHVFLCLQLFKAIFITHVFACHFSIMSQNVLALPPKIFVQYLSFGCNVLYKYNLIQNCVFSLLWGLRIKITILVSLLNNIFN